MWEAVPAKDKVVLGSSSEADIYTKLDSKIGGSKTGPFVPPKAVAAGMAS